MLISRVRSALVLSSCALLSSGCVFIDDFKAFEIVDVSQDASQDASEDTGVMANLGCVDLTLASEDTALEVSTAGAEDRYDAACGGALAPDKVVAWTAPATGFYRFYVDEADFEPVLSLREDDCDGPELDCSDAQTAPRLAELVRRVEAGQRVLLTLDGRSGDTGAGTVNVSPVACPAFQLTEALLPVAHSTSGRAPYEAMGCVEESSTHGARAYRFTAPEDGHYSFLAVGLDDGFQPAIQLEEGPLCGGARLQCSRAGENQHAEVLRSLRAGEHVTVHVAGANGDGDYRLDVTKTAHASCVDDEITDGMAAPFELTLLDNSAQEGPVDESRHRMSTSCAPPSVTDQTGGTATLRVRADLNLLLPANTIDPGCGGCSSVIRAAFPFYASTSTLDAEGACASRELSCQGGIESSTGQPSGYLFQLPLQLPHSASPTLLTIERENFSATEGSHIGYGDELMIEPFICHTSSPCF